MSHDTWVHRIARAAVVRPLARTRATPNHVTTVRLLVGLSAAACFAVGAPAWSLAGAALFVISFVLDRADGDLARVTGRTSSAGHTYDLVADTACNSLAFVGLGVGLTDSSLGSWAIVLGLMAGGGVAAVLILVMRVEKLRGARAAELRGIPGFDLDDVMLIVPIAVACDAVHGLLLASGVVTPIFTLVFLLVFRRRLIASEN